jgi:DNA-binding LacI/PurR family transcriptional regulator
VSAAHRAGAKAATEHLLALGHHRIAQICGPGGWAATEERVEGLQAAAERGLAVPDHLSVIGFDDSELARMVTPELTTVRQPRAELGRTAVSMLMRLIEGQRIEALRIELATQLIARDSTGPAPARR